jgi:hypothetical protein
VTADAETYLGAAEAPRVTARLARDLCVALVTVGGSLACWVLALRHTDLTKLSGYGLLTALPMSYYVGLVLLVGGFAYAATRPTVRPSVLCAHVLVLAAELHATTAVLYSEPRYSWVYKHLGVIDYIQQHGQVHRSIDIYQNWPAFFAVTAWVAKAAGIDPIALTPWAQVFFELLNVAAIVFAVRGLTRDPRRVWMAAFIFLAANWIGQDYLSPQAFAFLLATVAIGIALRLRTPDDVRGRGPGAVIDWILDDAPGTETLDAKPRQTALLVAGAVCALGVIISHQLSPAFLILDLCVLRVLTRRPSILAIGFVVAAEIGWVALGWTFISTHFNLFDFSSSLNNSPSTFSHPLPGVAMDNRGAQLSMMAMVALGFAGFVRAWRGGRRLIVPLALAAVPFPLVAAQRYGGEGPLRAYLFALPWLALLAAEVFVPGERPGKGRARPKLLAVAIAVVLGGTLLGYFGQETLNEISPDDVAASSWFFGNTPANAGYVLLAGNFPDRIDGNYAQHLNPADVLVRMPGVAGPQFATRGYSALERLLRTDKGKEEYVIVSPSQVNYLHYTGSAPDGAADQLRRTLERSADFRTVFRQGQSEIFRWVQS